MIIVNYLLEDESNKLCQKNNITEPELPYEYNEILYFNNKYYRITHSHYDYEIWQITGEYRYTAYVKEASEEFIKSYHPVRRNIKNKDNIKIEFTDEYGAIYGNFGECLKKGPTLAVRCYTIKEGTKTIKNHAFKDNNSIQEITIPDSVCEMGECTFENCTNLRKIRLSEFIEDINKFSFRNCKNLISINLPKQLKNIHYGAFYGCLSLEDFDFPSKIESIHFTAFECGCKWGMKYHLYEYFINNKKTYSYFSKSSKIFVYPEGTKGVFLPSNCPNLENIIIPNSTRVISGSGLNTCPKVKILNIPDGVEVIGEINSKWLEEIYIPSSVRCIQRKAFGNCQQLKKIYFADNCEIGIEQDYSLVAKYYNYLINYGPSYWDYFYGTFMECISLKEVHLPKKMKVIHTSMFEGCISLEEINIPCSIEQICSSAFGRCKSLKNINFNNSLKQIHSYAFSHCTQLKELILPPCKVSESAFPVEFINLDRNHKTMGNKKYIRLNNNIDFTRIKDYSKGEFLYNQLMEIYKKYMANEELLNSTEKELFERYSSVLWKVQPYRIDFYDISKSTRLKLYKAFTYCLENNLTFDVITDKNQIFFVFKPL